MLCCNNKVSDRQGKKHNGLSKGSKCKDSVAYAVEVKVDPQAVKEDQEGHLPSQKIIMELKDTVG